jgi:hypothetical protein
MGELSFSDAPQDCKNLAFLSSILPGRLRLDGELSAIRPMDVYEYQTAQR